MTKKAGVCYEWMDPREIVSESEKVLNESEKDLKERGKDLSECECEKDLSEKDLEWKWK